MSLFCCIIVGKVLLEADERYVYFYNSFFFFFPHYYKRCKSIQWSNAYAWMNGNWPWILFQYHTRIISIILCCNIRSTPRSYILNTALQILSVFSRVSVKWTLSTRICYWDIFNLQLFQLNAAKCDEGSHLITCSNNEKFILLKYKIGGTFWNNPTKSEYE